MKLHHLLFVVIMAVLLSCCSGCAKKNTESITIKGETFTKSAVLEKLKKELTDEGYEKADSAIQAAFNATARRDNPSALAALESVFRRGYFVNGDLGTAAENCVDKCRDDPEPMYCILKCHGL